LRCRSGCLFFERRSGAAALKAALAKSGILLGILSDQHAGDHGAHVPFFGRLCSTTAAPAVFALRYRCPLHVGLCFRTALGRWRIEVGDAIPIFENGHPRAAADIMRDVNKAFEAAILRDPANWFWVHNRWKLKPPQS
jgi:KDO2-lipid IV(A) lauroyltransferase